MKSTHLLQTFPTPADREAGIDRLWDASRPIEPTAAAWETLWAGVLDRLDAPAEAAPAPAPLRLEPVPANRWTSWRHKGRVALGLAQAAAILMAAGLLLRQVPEPRGRSTDPTAFGPQVVEVNIDAGQVILIHDQHADRAPLVLALETSADRVDSVDAQYLMFNALESLAQGGTNW